MAPPSFGELGKAARDVFSKGYNWGFFKFDAKTKTSSDIEIKASISSNRENGKVLGSLETKYKWQDYGLTLTEKWSTDNILNTEIKIEDKIVEGSELAFDVSYAPLSGNQSVRVRSGYKLDYFHLNCDVDFDGPTVTAASVFGYEGWLAGYQLGFDAAKTKITRSNFGFGYTGADFSFVTQVNNTWRDGYYDGQEFVGSLYHKVNDKLETAVNLSWPSGSGSTFAIGGRYKLDADASFSAKVNNQSHIGLGYTQTLKDDLANGGIKLKFTVSMLIDGKNINQGGHKVGLGLEFEA